MSVAERPRERLEEMREFVQLVKLHIGKFRAKIGIQVNFSCPNVGVQHKRILDEIEVALQRFSELDVPIAVKLSLTSSIEDMLEIDNMNGCDCLVITNTIPWQELPDEIDWNRYFRSSISPLRKRNESFGDGGLSGKPLFRPLTKRVAALRQCGFRKPINAGGGIWYRSHVDALQLVGANGISIGSVAMMRPWRVPEIIRRARQLSWPSMVNGANLRVVS